MRRGNCDCDEDRLARLPGLITEFGRAIPGHGQGTLHYTIQRARIATMLTPLDDPLPNCRLLATGAEFDDPSVIASTDGPDRVEAVTLAALDELAKLMRPPAR